jgi:hypothetical protein
MATECMQDSLDFGTIEGRAVVGAFDGGVISSDSGALLLGATERAIKLVSRFGACFSDARDADSIEHSLGTLVGQRVFGIALGYEDLNDHDELRHDPVMAVLAGKLKARRKNCAPVAGKSTLCRLEHAPEEGVIFAPSRYHKISHNAEAIEQLFVTLFLETHARPPKRIVIDLDATGHLAHDIGVRNAVQKLLYAFALIAMTLMVLSGLVLWKPVQFHELGLIMGQYEGARYVHFFGMVGIVLFLAAHIALTLLVPKVLLPMITGNAPPDTPATPEATGGRS